MPRTPETLAFEHAVAALASSDTSSTEIAAVLGTNPRRVRKVLLRLNLPRLPSHSPTGHRNASFAGGRRIDQNGYAHVSAPVDHPYAVLLPHKTIPYIREHRLVLERQLGRYLLPEEVVDHIDGLTLHNHPDNLRLFASNADHLRVTLGGKVPRWSAAGYGNMLLRHRQPEALQRVDTYRQRKVTGVIRLRQILLAALKFGTNSPYLLGTLRHTTTAGIDMSSHSTIAHALDALCSAWGLPRTP